MAKFQVTSERNSLASSHEGNRFEDGVGDGFSRKHVPSEKFVQRLCGDLLICDCLKHGERNAYDGRKGDSKEGSPDW